MQDQQSLKLSLLFISMLATSFSSISAIADISAPEGWYLEANLGSTSLAKKSYPGSASSSGIGANANIGYKFMPYLAAELGYTMYASTGIKTFSGTKAATDKHFAYDLAAKGILPVGHAGFEAFAKLGVDRQNSRMNVNNASAATSIGVSSGQHSATGIYMGFGGEYYFSPEFATNVQWAQAIGSSGTGTLSLFSVGMSYILG